MELKDKLINLYLLLLNKIEKKDQLQASKIEDVLLNGDKYSMRITSAFDDLSVKNKVFNIIFKDLVVSISEMEYDMLRAETNARYKEFEELELLTKQKQQEKLVDELLKTKL